MDVLELRTLIAGGETLTVEFKGESRQALSDRDLVDAVVCLANADGGTLLVGVEDDGSVTGARHRHGGRTDPHRLQALVANMTIPPLSVAATVASLDGHDVVVVQTAPSVIATSSSRGLFTRRALRRDGAPDCIPLSAHEIISRGFTATGRDYAGTVVQGITLDDLDTGAFHIYRELVGLGSGDRVLADLSDGEIARAIRVLTPAGEVTIGGILLFGTPELLEAHVPTHEVLFQELRGGQVIATHQTRSPLLVAAREVEQLLAVRNEEREVLSGLVRIAVPRFPQRVLREALANALVHRDYTELGPITVQLTDDALSVRSPGGFPSGISLNNILHETSARSPILAEAFKRAGFVDRAGKGVSDMYRAMLATGRGEPDYSRTTSHSVTVVIPTAGIDLEMTRFVASYEESNGPLELRDLRLLHEVRAQGATTAAELAEALDVPRGLVRPALTTLVERGLLEARGTGRGRQYHLASGFYQRAEDRSAYVRVRPLDPIRHEQMILTYVQEFGSITNGQVRELCGIDAGQARRLLRSLVDSGSLELHGERRGAHYRAPGAATTHSGESDLDQVRHVDL